MHLVNFLRDDAGVVTVDWVALSASALMLGLATIYAVYNTGVASLVNSINASASQGIDRVDPGDLSSLEAQNQGAGG